MAIVPDELDAPDFGLFYKKPMGTFEFMMTNGTKFDRIYDFHKSQESSKTKFSISSASDIFFDVDDIADQLSFYLHTTILVEQYYRS